MTCSSIKIIYLTILETLACPLLHCFSLLNPNYIVLFTSIQTLQTASLTLSVPEENYDKITEVLKKNPSLLNKLIEQTENSKPQTSLVPQGGRFTNGLSSFLSRPFSGFPTVKNPVTVALPTETMIGGQKFVLSNRLSLYGNLLKKIGSTITSPVKKSFNYFKNLGETQEITKNALKFISNKFKNNEGNQSEEEEEEEERSKKSKKKNVKKKGKKNKKKSSKKISDEDDASSDEDEKKANDKGKKGGNKNNNKNKSKEKSSEEKDSDEDDASSDEDEKKANDKGKKGGNKKNNKNKSKEKSSEEKDSDEDDASSDEEEENPGRKKDPKKKKNNGDYSKSDDDKSDTDDSGSSSK